SWIDSEKRAIEHNYQYKSTADEHWKECSNCGDVIQKAAHKLSEWKTVTRAGYSFEGERQRVCRACEYTVSESIPMLKLPENKVVVSIPDFPSFKVEETTKTTTGPSTGRDKSSMGTVRELLTKGTDNTVPALPKLAPKDEGYLFEGWVIKETNEPVKKGDKLTGNIEIIPVWKDCGDNKHTDANTDYACDECGFKLPVPEQPVSEPAAETVPADAAQENKGGSAMGLVAVAAAAAAGGGYIMTKKKKEEEQK
ncbi:MAG: hypothetical protein II995_01105, partial [Oscillospiraceae bacterium]|nr:hypothetical protein [Oscillospiraceae bacterium]